MFAMISSGIVMELGLALVAPAHDYRYSHWLVICTSIGVVALVALRRRR